MYRKICARPSRRVAIFDDQILNWHNDGGSHKHWLSELTLDGAVLSESPIPDEHLRTIGLECGQCMVEYEPSGGESSLSCFAPCGALLVSIKGLGEYPEVVPRGASEFYLLGQHLFSYNSRTLQHEDLGLAPWDLPLYRGACGGLHFLTEAWQTRLLALRDAGGGGWRRSGGSTSPNATSMWAGTAVLSPGR